MLEAKERQAWMKSRRNKRKVARHARVRQQMLRYLLMLLMVSSGIWFLGQTDWRLKDLNRDLVVKGNLYASSKDIREKLSKYRDLPVYEIDPKLVEKDVEELEAVKFAFVRRYVFPSPRLIVKVKEEFPWATLTSDPEKPGQYVIAESGKLVPVGKFPAYPKPPLTISVDSKRAKKLFAAQDVKQWATWIGYIEKQTDEKVVLVDLRHQYDVRVKTDKTVFRLGIPDTTLTQRLGRIASIMSTIEQYRAQLDYVDLALDNNIPLKIDKNKKVAEAKIEKPAQISSGEAQEKPEQL